MARHLRAAVLAASYLAGQAAAQQSVFRDYAEAGDVFWGALYPAAFEELYCGREVAARGGHNIEHVFPAFWLTKALQCGSRRQCRSTSEIFNRAEADLHNLYPTRTEVNSRRGSLAFGEIPGEAFDFPGCDFEQEGSLVEPREEARGDIARAILYMAQGYGAEAGMPPGQIDLMRTWDALDPPDADERARNVRIAELQGVTNPFIDSHEEALATDGAPTVADEPEGGVRVRLATWNIANLHHEVGEHLPGRPNAARRSQEDFDRLARYVEELDADIVAFQEVNGPEAAARIFPPEEWEVVISSRYAEDQATGRETDHIYTGVAVRKDGAVTFIASQTYDELSVMHEQGGALRPTRRGTEVLVELPNGEPLQLMSIHLKSSCHQGSLEQPSSSHCRTLAAQRVPLEAWVDALTLDNTPFALAGDWNRRIDIHGEQDHLWEEIDDGDPAPLDLFRFPENVTSPCLAGTPAHRPQPIDFIVLDEQAARWADPESARIVDFHEADKFERDRISDHCPVVLDLIVPTSGGG